MFPCFIYLDWFPKLINTASQESSNFHFKVQSFAFAETWFCGIFRLYLPSWPVEISSTDHHRRRSAMVPDGNMQPIFIQGILWASDDWTDIERMRSRWIKVSIVSDLYWYMKLYIADLVHKLAFQCGFAGKGGIGAENVLDCQSGFYPILSWQWHEWVEVSLLEDLFAKFWEELTVEQSMILHLS